jgi:EAL domain-containing protein (putative c-di-GMP-specific phosphodiesterase class I)
MSSPESCINVSEHVLDLDDAPAVTWLLAGCLGEHDPLCRVQVNASPFRVGRSPGMDLALKSRLVSKSHAFLITGGDDLFVRDLNSTNGTFVNGKRITNDTPVGEGDLLQFADTEFRLERITADWGERTSVTGIGSESWVLSNFDELIRSGGVFAVFQPIVSLHTSHTLGYEALARSNIPGVASAGEMFSLAARLHSEARLSHQCRLRAGEAARLLPHHPKIFVNTCGVETADGGLLKSLRLLRESYPEVRFAIEVNEKTVSDPQGMAEFARGLRDLEIDLAFDDFGAGQSRLRELMNVAPNYVKFDASLVRDLHLAAKRERDFVQTLVRIVRELGIQAIAEGVECHACALACQEVGFGLGQGNYFGRPSPADAWQPRPAGGADTYQDFPVFRF